MFLFRFNYFITIKYLFILLNNFLGRLRGLFHSGRIHNRGIRRRFGGGSHGLAVRQPHGFDAVGVGHAQLHPVEALQDLDDVFVLDALHRLGGDVRLHEGVVHDLAHGGDAADPQPGRLHDVGQEGHASAVQTVVDFRLVGVVFAFGVIVGDIVDRHAIVAAIVVQIFEVVLHLEAVEGIRLGVEVRAVRVQIQRGLADRLVHVLGGDVDVLVIHGACQHHLAVQVHELVKDRGLRLDGPLLVAGVGVLMLRQPAHQLPGLVVAGLGVHVLRQSAHRQVLQRIGLEFEGVQGEEQHKRAQYRDDPPELALLHIPVDFFLNARVLFQDLPIRPGSRPSLELRSILDILIVLFHIPHILFVFLRSPRPGEKRHTLWLLRPVKNASFHDSDLFKGPDP